MQASERFSKRPKQGAASRGLRRGVWADRGEGWIETLGRVEPNG